MVSSDFLVIKFRVLLLLLHVCNYQTYVKVLQFIYIVDEQITITPPHSSDGGCSAGSS